jgi:hypothetical protein
MIGMMGGGMGGGMGGMGGGMGGMGGGMGGGMRSVPPSSLPSALLGPSQTRELPTRLVSLTPPDDPAQELSLPAKGEKLRIVGDVSKVNDDARVQKALKRLTAEMAPTSLTQLVMMRLSTGLEWDAIAQASEKWANEFELTLAKDFVDRLESLPEGESGRILIQVEGKDGPGEAIAKELASALAGKTVLGLVASVGKLPAEPDGPVVACLVRVGEKEALVQVTSTDSDGAKWITLGKFTVPITGEAGQARSMQLADLLSEGVLNRLVRAQVVKGSAQKNKGKLVYQLRIDNASPLVLNGLAIVGTGTKTDETPKVLSMISVSPRKSLTVPTDEDSVRSLGLKKGIKVLALDLSGL